MLSRVFRIIVLVLAFTLAGVGLTLAATSPAPIDQHASATTSLTNWSVLVLIYPTTDTDYIVHNGMTQHYSNTLTITETDQLLKSVYDFTARVQDWSNGMATVSTTVRVVTDTAITHVTLVTTDTNNKNYPYYWLMPSDTEPRLTNELSSGSYDSVFVFWNSGKIGDPNSIPTANYEGLSYNKAITYKGSFTFTWSTGIYSGAFYSQYYPGEGIVHEWLHGVTGYYRGLGYQVADADDSAIFGIPQDFNGSWAPFYRDLMQGQLVTPDNEYSAISDMVWRAGNVRAVNRPLPAQLLSPIDGASVNISPQLKWAKTIDPGDTYLVTVFDAANPAKPVYSTTTTLNSITIPRGTLALEKTYEWTVRAMHNNAQAPASAPISFQTRAYDAALDFSPLHNPSGPWSYGWSSALTSAFNPFTVTQQQCGLDQWYNPDASNGGYVMHNGTAGSVNCGTGFYSPGQLALHPGHTGQYSRVRWTAPYAGTYSVIANFIGMEQTRSDVHVLHNGTRLFDGHIESYGAMNWGNQTTVDVNPGDTIEFVVGRGSDNNDLGDTTGLVAQIIPSTSESYFTGGDIVVGGDELDNVYTPYGVLWLLRGGSKTVLLQSDVIKGLFTYPRDMLIDARGRLVFSGYPPNSGNANNSALLRADPSTGVVQLLQLYPYIIGPSQPAPSVTPSGATGFYDCSGMSAHSVTSLGVSIVDTKNGGQPQIINRQAYEHSVGVRFTDNHYEPYAFRYMLDDGTLEPGIDVSSLVTSTYNSNCGARLTGSYYASGSLIRKAKLCITVNINIGGVAGSVSICDKHDESYEGIIDKEEITNVTVTCTLNGTQLTDHDVPMEGGGFIPLGGIYDLGLMGGNLFAVSNYGGTGGPYIFDFRSRDPFLNPSLCAYQPAIKVSVPISYYVDNVGAIAPTGIAVQGGNILAVQNFANRLLAVSGNNVSVLRDDLSAPTGVAAYGTSTRAPVKADAATTDSASALIARVDDLNVNVLITDPTGKRIGRAADGSEINDFGSGGAIFNLNAGNPPQVYAVISPTEGIYTATVAGLSTGPYTLQGYLADTSIGGTHSTTDGFAHAGITETRSFTVTLPLTLQWQPSANSSRVYLPVIIKH